MKLSSTRIFLVFIFVYCCSRYYIFGDEKTTITITLTAETGNPELFAKTCFNEVDFDEDSCRLNDEDVKLIENQDANATTLKTETFQIWWSMTTL
jgi:hypothetical protein